MVQFSMASAPPPILAMAPPREFCPVLVVELPVKSEPVIVIARLFWMAPPKAPPVALLLVKVELRMTVKPAL